MRPKKRLQLRIIATVLCAAFFTQELGAAPIAALSAPSLSPQEQLLRQPEGMEVPLDFARLSEVHRGSRDVFIIHIQDAHSNVSGQQNLAGTLEALMTKYGVRLVLSEGGEGDCSLTSVKKIASPDVWKRVAKSFLLKGEIQGEEYLNLVSDHPMKIVGIEESALYDASLAHYARLAESREKAIRHLQKIETAVEKLKNRFYPKPLRGYEEMKKKDAGFEKTFPALLLQRAEAGLEPAGPETVKMSEALRQEKALNFGLANLERGALLEELHQKGRPEKLEAALAAERKIGKNRAALLAHFEKTLNLARASGMDISKYENLNAYLDYLRAFAAVDMEALLSELETEENELYDATLEGDAALVRGIDRFTALQRSAHEIQMTTQQHARFKAWEPDFGTIPVEGFLNRKLAEEGYFDDLVPHDTTLDEARKAVDDFYDSVSERDEAFVRNIEKTMKAEGERVAFLITGGYHTEHLKTLLKEKGYGYAVLTPIVTSETNQKKYESLLLGGQAKRSTLRVHLAAAVGSRLSALRNAATREVSSGRRQGLSHKRWRETPHNRIRRAFLGAALGVLAASIMAVPGSALLDMIREPQMVREGLDLRLSKQEDGIDLSDPSNTTVLARAMLNIKPFYERLRPYVTSAAKGQAPASYENYSKILERPIKYEKNDESGRYSQGVARPEEILSESLQLLKSRYSESMFLSIVQNARHLMIFQQSPNHGFAMGFGLIAVNFLKFEAGVRQLARLILHEAVHNINTHRHRFEQDPSGPYRIDIKAMSELSATISEVGLIMSTQSTFISEIYFSTHIMDGEFNGLFARYISDAESYSYVPGLIQDLSFIERLEKRRAGSEDLFVEFLDAKYVNANTPWKVEYRVGDRYFTRTVSKGADGGSSIGDAVEIRPEESIFLSHYHKPPTPHVRRSAQDLVDFLHEFVGWVPTPRSEVKQDWLSIRIQETLRYIESRFLSNSVARPAAEKPADSDPDSTPTPPTGARMAADKLLGLNEVISFTQRGRRPRQKDPNIPPSGPFTVVSAGNFNANKQLLAFLNGLRKTHSDLYQRIVSEMNGPEHSKNIVVFLNKHKQSLAKESYIKLFPNVEDIFYYPDPRDYPGGDLLIATDVNKNIYVMDADGVIYKVGRILVVEVGLKHYGFNIGAHNVKDNLYKRSFIIAGNSSRPNANVEELIRTLKTLRSDLTKRAKQDTDPLTGLRTLRFIENDLREAFKQDRLSKFPISMIRMSLDGFGEIGDWNDPAVRDEVLGYVGGVLRGVMFRETNIFMAPGTEAFHMGEGKFTIFLPGMDINQAMRVAEEIRRALAAPNRPITASLGVAQRRSGEMLGELTKKAREALREAEATGNTVVAHSEPSGTYPFDGAPTRPTGSRMAERNFSDVLKEIHHAGTLVVLLDVITKWDLGPRVQNLKSLLSNETYRRARAPWFQAVLEELHEVLHYDLFGKDVTDTEVKSLLNQASTEAIIERATSLASMRQNALLTLIDEMKSVSAETPIQEKFLNNVFQTTNKIYEDHDTPIDIDQWKRISDEVPMILRPDAATLFERQIYQLFEEIRQFSLLKSILPFGYLRPFESELEKRGVIQPSGAWLTPEVRAERKFSEVLEKINNAGTLILLLSAIADPTVGERVRHLQSRLSDDIYRTPGSWFASALTELENLYGRDLKTADTAKLARLLGQANKNYDGIIKRLKLFADDEHQRAVFDLIDEIKTASTTKNGSPDFLARVFQRAVAIYDDPHILINPDQVPGAPESLKFGNKPYQLFEAIRQFSLLKAALPPGSLTTFEIKLGEKVAVQAPDGAPTRPTGSRMAEKSVTAADAAAVQADEKSKQLFAQIYLARKNSILAKKFNFLLEELNKTTSFRFVEAAEGVVSVQFLDLQSSNSESPEVLFEYDLTDAIEAQKSAKLVGVFDLDRLESEAETLTRLAVLSGSLGRLAITARGAVAETTKIKIFERYLPHNITPEELTRLARSKKAAKQYVGRAYFRYLQFQDNGWVVLDAISDAMPPERELKGAVTVRLHEPTTELVDRIEDGVRYLPLQVLERTENDTEVFAEVAIGIAASILADTDTIETNEPARQLFSRLSDNKVTQSEYSRFVRVDKKNISFYETFSVKKIGRITFNKILQFTQMALQALGSAA